MKQIIFFGIFLLFVSARESNAPVFGIFIVQGKLRTEVKYDDPKTIKLKKKPFTIEIHLKNLEGVYLSSSFSTEYYNTPLNQRFKDWEAISAKVMAEENFNKGKELYMDEEAIHYWFYDPKLDWHRLDKKVIVHQEETIATFKVNSLFDVDSKAVVKMANTEQPLYLVFFSADEVTGANRKELQRNQATLIFE